MSMATASLAQDIASFALSLCRLYRHPIGARDEREAAREVCRLLLQQHFGPNAPLRLDVGSEMEATVLSEVRQGGPRGWHAYTGE
jgi:hypothetical protein